MTEEETRSGPATDLRLQAEEIARERAAQSPQYPEAMSPEEIQWTLHELRVHQIELEIQNEELRRVQTELDTARARYFDLYELAPVGYITVSEKGIIQEANLTACRQLGVARSAVVLRPLTAFILREDQDIYYLYGKQLFEAGVPRPCKLRMLKEGRTAFWAQLEATAALDADGAPICRVVISDITDLQRTEENARKSQKQLRDAQQLAHIGVWIWTAETDTVTWTEELYRIAGIDPMLPAPTYAEHPNLYVPESWDRLKEAVERAREAGVPYQLELELIRPDGATRWVNAFGGAIYDHHGRLTGLQGTVQDITERKLAETMLRDSEALYQSLVNHLPQCVFRKDLESRFTFANLNFCRLLGKTSAEILGRTDFDFYPPALAEKYRCDDQRIMREGRLVELVEQHVLPDGKDMIVQVVKSPLVNAAGETVGLQALFGDITAQKRAEEKLQSSEIRYRRLFESAKEGILILDAETGQIVDANPFLMEMLGFSHEQLLGKAVWDLGILKDLIANQDNFLELQQKEYIRYEDLPLETADGRHIDVEFVSNVYLVDNKKVIQCDIRDNTERKRAEAEKGKLQA